MDSPHQEIARCLFREANDALFIFDPRDHRVLDVNPAALRLTGFEKDFVCTLRVQDLFTSAEPGGLGWLIDAYRRTGFYHSREGYFLGREVGEPIPINVSVSRIHTAPEPLGLVVARDITERIRAQEALRESENRYRGLVETAKVIIWALSADGRIESLNPAFEEITGWPRARWIGRPFTELVHTEDSHVASECFDRALRGELLPPYELRIGSAADQELVLEVLSAAHQFHGDRVSVSGIARDVTERKRAEEALQRAEAMRLAKEAAEAADRAKSEFLGHISHEIRTPMTAVLGFTDVLLEDERVRALPTELLDDLRTIKQNGNHLLSLINDILDLTMIEVGRLRIHRSPCSPARLVEDVAASMRPRTDAKGLALVLELAPDVPATVRTDAVRLRQILINLVSNAIKFTRSGGIRLQVKHRREPGTEPMLQFTVIDTGIGMPDAEVSHIFEPFYTSETHTTRESGTGLGLAISRRLAEMLGGRLDVRSRPGEGSSFTLLIPIGATTPAWPEQTEALAAAEPGGSPLPTTPLGGRVLLAEDNEPIQRFVRFRLQQSGAEVVVAGNGQEAVELALAARDASRPFDWILMDVQMPVLDGYEATRQLRDQGYRWPIIALTAYASAENREECLKFGWDDYVSKPVDCVRLLEVLHAHRVGKPETQTPQPASPASGQVNGGRS
ncbi:MAG TPA: PAS domain S-box protein [Isosphaeraceae bacterium]|jgi:PAS domain S-box-containing protein|nr:PAS domain S-box protein [Isosphaeraceae bacterium]